MQSIFQSAYCCLQTSNPSEKCNAVFQMRKQLDELQFSYAESESILPIAAPGRPELPKLVMPRDVPRRSLASDQGRAALVHAITHIEFNAVNLALDAIYRFQTMPKEYYRDWMQVAYEEAQHFSMLRERLQQLGYEYGDFDAHNGLWEMAIKTSTDIISRMALVPRVLEARGLDVTPSMIKKLEQFKDNKTVEILKIIFQQEIGHVAIGTRWFNYACEQKQLNAEETFKDLLQQHYAGELRGPFELEARKQAGFSDAELDSLQNI